MKQIDSLLKILLQQQGTELRLLSDSRPQMFKGDRELPLTIPAMSAETIQALLGDLWTSQAVALREQGSAALAYQSAELGHFDVTLIQEGSAALQVVFRLVSIGPALNAPSNRVPDGGRGSVRAAPRPAPGGDRAPPSIRDAFDDATDRVGDELAPTALPPGMLAVLTRAASLHASDVHFSPQQPPVARVNGVLAPLDAAHRCDVTALLSPAQLEQARAGRSVDLALDVPSVGRLRVNVYASEEGLCAAVRILRREAPALSGLNLPPVVEPLIDFPHGLVIACGPTGSGKSTTLAALVQQAMRARPQLLITLEDPIEYVIRPLCPGGLVRQREVGTHVRDFATGLRDALREDPDMLLIGEMRDTETISLALTAAETGHLVLTSLHSRTASSAIERIVDTYPPERQRQIRVQLADALRAVISQRLLPTADGTGRVPAVELLRVTYAVANLIREGRTAYIVSAIQAGANEGMLVLERSLADLIRANRIRHDVAVAVANDVAMLSEYTRSL